MGKHTSEQNCLLGPLARLPGEELQPPTREPSLQSSAQTHMPPCYRGETLSKEVFKVHSGTECIMSLCWGGGAGLFMPINAIFNFC